MQKDEAETKAAGAVLEYRTAGCDERRGFPFRSLVAFFLASATVGLCCAAVAPQISQYAELPFGSFAEGALVWLADCGIATVILLVMLFVLWRVRQASERHWTVPIVAGAIHAGAVWGLLIVLVILMQRSLITGEGTANSIFLSAVAIMLLGPIAGAYVMMKRSDGRG
ncbi:MAG: hypothetical protein NTU53_02750 [Planctomycetota bacterium]|nr:hypothetical protein [Planctomycetota bacterium]